MVAVGGLFSLVAAAGALLVARETSLIDTQSLISEGPKYFVAHPLRGLLLLAGGAVSAFLLAWAAARLAYRGHLPTQSPGTTWWHVLGARKEVAAAATLGLRSGRTVQGVVRSYSMNPPTEPRDIALGKPLREVDAAGNVLALSGDVLMVSETEIAWIAIDYIESSIRAA